jgi:hypothetical protein
MEDCGDCSTPHQGHRFCGTELTQTSRAETQLYLQETARLSLLPLASTYPVTRGRRTAAAVLQSLLVHVSLGFPVVLGMNLGLGPARQVLSH